MCEAFQEHFAQLFGGRSGPESRGDLTELLADLLCLSERDAERYQRPITPEKVIKAMADCGTGKVPGLDGLPYELYKSMPNFFEPLQAEVYTNWQQNGFIPRSARRGEVTLVRTRAKGTL